MHRHVSYVLLLSLLLLSAGRTRAETGANAWLRYAPPPDPPRYHDLPHAIVRLGNAAEEISAAEELDRGLSHMIAGSDVLLDRFDPGVDSIVLATTEALHRVHLNKHLKALQEKPLPSEGFRILHLRSGARQWWIIQGGSPRAELYGAFRFMNLVAQDRQLPEELIDAPSSTIRWIDQWDNLDGTVERGYAGASIFFQDGHLRSDLSRVHDYARLLSSIGINGITVNNVNSDPRTLTPAMIDEFARLSNELRPWGIRLALSVDLTSPKTIGGLASFDPLDPQVLAWWQSKVDEVYRAIPDFAGFTVKVDSEGRPGPLQYGLTPASAANSIARPLARHGGLLLYRTFFNSPVDFLDPKADRALAAYDRFHLLDGRFLPNVILQIKQGPVDFQVREPVSPLIPAMRHTAQAMELQITQEYTGQQRHMVYLAPGWKKALDTDLRVDAQPALTRDVVTGRLFHQPQGGFVGVANVGMDSNWLHHPMAMANLYSFGRLAWNPAIDAHTILDEWTRMTWSNDARIYGPIEAMNLASGRAFEQYTGPLGLGTLTNLAGSHYGPGPQTADRNTVGQGIRADGSGVGMDRTVASGTGLIGQYPAQLAAIYDSSLTCSDDLLLFMHHVPYDRRLRGDVDPSDAGNTVIQHIYDAHYAGSTATQNFLDQWESLKGLVDEARYTEVHDLLLYQSRSAEVWRDTINHFFFRISGIPDALGFADRHPGRIEAESLPGIGFRTVLADAVDAASGGRAALCEAKECTLATVFQGDANPYRVEVGYFDLHPGEARYRLLVNHTEIAHWTANDSLPPDRHDPGLNGNTATRFTLEGVRLKPGDTITLEATPDGEDPAAVDFLEITRDPRWN